MKVAVAGGSGFIGRHAVAALQARGHDVVVLARGTRAAVPGAPAVAWDAVRDPAPAVALAGCGAIVNLVGLKREDRAQTFEALHVDATRRLLDAARATGARLVQVSVVA